MVFKSRSRSVKSEEQNPHRVVPPCRGAPHEEQRTTAASLTPTCGTLTIPPHEQRKQSSSGTEETSYWSEQTGQITNRRNDLVSFPTPACRLRGRSYAA